MLRRWHSLMLIDTALIIMLYYSGRFWLALFFFVLWVGLPAFVAFAALIEWLDDRINHPRKCAHCDTLYYAGMPIPPECHVEE